jgi:hypothetical protein
VDLDPMAIPFVRERVEPFGIPQPAPLDCFAICGGNLSLLACAAAFLWPHFEQIGDVTVRAGRGSDATIEDWKRTLDGDLRAVERVVNHEHLWDLITSDIPPEDDFPDSQCLGLAEAIARSWDAALKVAYPNRTFRVDTYDDGDGGPTDMVITFWEAR